MKKAVFAALIAATALVPMVAQAQERWQGGQDRGQQRGGQRGDGGGRQWQPHAGSDRAQPQASPAPAAQPQPQAQAAPRAQWQGRSQGQPGAAQGDGQRQVRGGPRGFGGQPNGQQGYVPQRDAQGQRVFTGQRQPDGRREGDGQRGYAGQRGPDGQRGYADRRGGPNGYRGDPRPGQAFRGDAYRGGGRDGAWSRGWRNDNRYNWLQYRYANRGAFHLPRYYAPRGWGYGYRRFGIGFTLSEILFAEQYWIDDPWNYRLPPAYGPYRWVRYYDDALLVDIDTGEVVDVVYDIFW